MKRTLVIVGLGLIGGARTAQGAARVPNGFYLLGRNTRKGHAASVKRQSR